MAAVAELLGTPLMPWQRQVVDVGLEVDPETGILAYREVVITVMRQSGKTTLVLSLETERCLAWEEPQRVAYTAQTGWDARRKLIDDQAPMLMRSALKDGVRRVMRGAGNEGVWFRNDARITVMASSEDAGHGSVIDLGVLDECWKDEDDRREQALLPAMSTRPNAQILLCSTQGTDKSTYLNRKVERGRAAVGADRGSGIAYFEWSIPLDADIENPEVWWQYMPALGWTISEAAVAHAFQTMDEAEWRRAYGNQPTLAAFDRILPLALWQAVVVPQAQVNRTQPLTFAVDVLPDRSRAALAVSDGRTVELVESRTGTGWVAERVKDIVQYGELVVDGGGPGASLADELERAGLRVRRMTNAEVVAACAQFYDAVADGRVTIRQADPFDTAAAGLAKKPVGDRFVWARATSQTDITPLFAATLALSGNSKAAPVAFYSFD